MTRYCIFLFMLFLNTANILFSQNSLGNRLDFACKQCHPTVALVQLSRQTGVNLAFSDQLFEDCAEKDFSYKNEKLSTILGDISSCTKVSYREINNQVVFFRKQQKFRLAGYVEDAETGERLIGAVVRIPSAPTIGTVTNEFGFFSLLLDEGDYTVSFSYIGFETAEQTAKIGSNQLLRIALKTKTALPEVVISALQPGGDSVRNSGNRQDLPLAVLHTIAMPGGESDVIRLAALQSGVQTGTDGLGGFHVRGGNADQNLVLLDDVPVYNPSHALGLLSVFNPGTVSNVKLWKGDFPARYSGRASSVLDVRTRDGNAHAFKGRASVGLFASTVELEGPLVKEKCGFLLAARGSYFDPWIKVFSKRENLITYPEESRVFYRFYDINAKVHYVVSPKDRLYLSFYGGNDRFNNRFGQEITYTEGVSRDVSQLSTQWGNGIAAFRWNHLFRSNLFSNTTLTYSRFLYESRLGFSSRFYNNSGKIENFLDVQQLYQTYIKDWAGKTDFTYYYNNNTTFRWGASLTRHTFKPGALSVDLLRPGQNESSLDSLSLLNNEVLFANESSIYMESDWKFWRGWQLMSGLNFGLFGIESTLFPTLQPRLQLRKYWKNGWAIWGGYHHLTQYLHQIGSFNVNLPFELWVPSTQKVLPEISYQMSGGFGWQKNGWNWQVEAYSKRLDRVIAFLPANDAIYVQGAENASGWQDRIATGKGWGRGVEFIAEHTTGKTTGSLAYTMSWAWRKFDDINQGRPFPFRFDRRHDIKLNLRQRINSWLNADVTAVFATGNPITLTGVKYNHNSPLSTSERVVYVYTDVNSYRLPNYHRLDIALNARFGSPKLMHQVQLGTYNTYNRQNPFFLYVDASSSIKGKAIQYTLLPILPVFRYEAKF